MHPVLAAGLEVARYCRCSHSSGTSLSDFLIVEWLWREFHWWSIAIYAGFALVIGMLKAALGGSGDAC